MKKQTILAAYKCVYSKKLAIGWDRKKLLHSNDMRRGWSSSLLLTSWLLNALIVIGLLQELLGSISHGV